MDDSIGIRDLRKSLSAVLKKVRRGGVVKVTSRDKPVALISPYPEGDVDGALQTLVRSGKLSWSGGRPAGLKRAPAVRGAPVSDAVLEDRR